MMDCCVKMVAHHGGNMVQWQMMACIVMVVRMVMQRLHQGLAAGGGRTAAGLGMKDKVLAQMAHALPRVAGRQASMQHIGDPSSFTLFPRNIAKNLASCLPVLLSSYIPKFVRHCWLLAISH
jgi:hypothetical protein